MDVGVEYAGSYIACLAYHLAQRRSAEHVDLARSVEGTFRQVDVR